MMKEKQQPHFRHEYKYLIDARQDAILRVHADCLMQRDPHVQKDGSYLIRSVYFDDLSDTCLRENMDGTDPRSKFRIRYYNSDTRRLTLEKKSKVRGMCLKEACSISLKECRQMLRGEIPDAAQDDPDEKKALLAEMRMRGMLPKVVVTYRRFPFIYPAGNVRVTFDGNITSSFDCAHFLSGSYPERPVLPEGQSVLEVKWDELLPGHIREVLQLENLTWSAFSKYFMCRTYHL